MLSLLLTVLHAPAWADGIPQNALGLELREPAQLELDGFDAVQVSRRVTMLTRGIDLALLPTATEARQGWWASGTLGGDQVYGVGVVNAVCDDTALRTAFECPRNTNARPVPLDAMQTSLSVGIHRDDWSFVYTGRITQLQLEPRTLMRPMFPQVFTTLYAPLLPANMVLDRIGVTELLGFPRTTHLLAAAWRPDPVELRLGLTLEGRLYARFGHPETGLHIETLLRRNLTGAKHLALGVRRWTVADEDAGASTLVVRRLDLVDVRTLRNQTTPVNLDKLGQLARWDVLAAHEDIVGVLDLRAGASLQPNANLTELSAGLHTTSWLRSPASPGARVALGVAGSPRVPGYQLGRLASPMATLAGRVPLGETGLALSGQLGFNDPTHLAELPTAVGAVSAMFQLSWPAVQP